MQLIQQPPDTRWFVRRHTPTSITVAERELSRSFVLSPDTLIEEWPVRDAAAMTAVDLDPVLALTPEVVLLGTGARGTRPPAATLAVALTRGIGIEVMDNAAAARTFNLLAQEGRRVVAAFVLPG